MCWPNAHASDPFSAPGRMNHFVRHFYRTKTMVLFFQPQGEEVSPISCGSSGTRETARPLWTPSADLMPVLSATALVLEQCGATYLRLCFLLAESTSSGATAGPRRSAPYLVAAW